MYSSVIDINVKIYNVANLPDDGGLSASKKERLYLAVCSGSPKKSLKRRHNKTLNFCN